VSSIEYLDQLAATRPARDYKRRLFEALDIQPGQVVLDVGCGPGTDLAGLATAVAGTGTVLGVDHDPAMVAEAVRRTAGLGNVEVRTGDAHALPVDDASVDRARADRVLQHLTAPAQALAELFRVIRPGGLLGLVEPDWDTLVIDDPDELTSRDFTRFLADVQVRNGAIGRQLGRLATGAGFAVADLAAATATFRDVEAADQILGVRRNARRAVDAGRMTPDATEQWLGRLTDGGPFLATFTFFTVIAVRAGDGVPGRHPPSGHPDHRGST